MANWTKLLEHTPGPIKGCPLCVANVPHERHITRLEQQKLGIKVGSVLPADPTDERTL